MWAFGERCFKGSLSDVAATCNVSFCCDTWEEVPLMFDMLGDVSRKGDIWELWIVFQRIDSLIDGFQKCLSLSLWLMMLFFSEPLYFHVGETIVLATYGIFTVWNVMGSIDFIKIQTEVYLCKTSLHLFSLGGL